MGWRKRRRERHSVLRQRGLGLIERERQQISYLCLIEGCGGRSTLPLAGRGGGGSEGVGAQLELLAAMAKVHRELSHGEGKGLGGSQAGPFGYSG